ncbi:MAG TPA: hypothetical protein PLO88_05625 [Bacilli bacterium]|nr:hypothetical protein [Bacilli bacterium]
MTKTDFNQLYNNFTNIAMEARISFRIKKLLFELPSSEDGFNKLITTIQETNITKAQALNDIEDFFLTMKYCYSGYEYFSRRIDFDTLKRNIIDLLEKSSNAYISSIALGEMIFNQLSGHLNDGHFSIIGFGNFLTSWRAYVTQIVVEKDGGKYRVIKGSRKLPIGTVIEHSDLAGKLLPTLIIGNHYDCFLIGIYSQKVINEINVGDVVLRTHMIGADKYVKENSGYLQKYEEHRDYNVFFSKSYQIDYNPEAILDEYYQFGKKTL